MINDGPRGWTLNTISRLYAEGAMFSHQGLVETPGNRMPWMLVREMIADPRGFEPSGRRALRGVIYDLIRRSETTLWAHPETSLIHAVS